MNDSYDARWHNHSNDEITRNPWRIVDRYGFVDNDETTLSFASSTLTLTAATSTWRYMRQGIINYITGNKTCDLTNTDGGTYYFYMDDDIGTISCATASWTLDDTKVCVAMVTYNSTLTPTYLLQDERHTCTIDRKDHRYNHLTRSTQLVSGGALSGYTLNTDTDAANTWAIAEALIADEDLFHTLTALSDGNGAGTPYAVLYRTAAAAWSWKLSAVPFDYTSSGYINYDSSGTQTQGASNKYYNYWLAYTNITGDFRFVTIPGRAEYSSAAAAYAEDVRNYTWGGLPTAEFCIAFQITFRTLVSYGSTGKVQIIRVAQLNYSNVAAGVPVPVTYKRTLPFATYQALPYNYAVTSNYQPYNATLIDDCMLVDYAFNIYIVTTNDVSNYYSIEFRNSAGTPYTTAVTTAALAANAWNLITGVLNIPVTAATDKMVYVYITETGSPGNLYMTPPNMNILTTV